MRSGEVAINCPEVTYKGYKGLRIYRVLGWLLIRKPYSSPCTQKHGVLLEVLSGKPVTAEITWKRTVTGIPTRNPKNMWAYVRNIPAKVITVVSLDLEKRILFAIFPQGYTILEIKIIPKDSTDYVRSIDSDGTHVGSQQGFQVLHASTSQP